MGRKKVAVLGASGSIGRNALDVLRFCHDDFDLALASVHSKSVDLAALAREFPAAAVAASGLSREAVQEAVPSVKKVFGGGPEAVLRALEEIQPDIVINGIAGSAGLLPSFKSVELGAVLALANKESVVMAWDALKANAAKTGARIIPVDSECSAIFNLAARHGARHVKRVILTASGGPFRTYSLEQMSAVTIEKALAHPTWKMGPKITLDSASLANKGLEVIQISKIMEFSPHIIAVSVHPQSIVHSMLAMADGAVYAALSAPDMRLPIHQALHFPALAPSPWGELDFDMASAPPLTLSFEKPDMEKFPMLRLAYDAAERGGFYPLAYNTANEYAGSLFLKGAIPFLDIPAITSRTLERDWNAPPGAEFDSAAILDAEKSALAAAKALL
ncbi:MAG: 1-deoxy-D-xylulose-5-phosphate reductoisomerase [Spirochaetaceae bacterium]|jgi:1-deoxy-D-xylulose-5-phosphate reductoisomerase|nr:1-deoxy-D-xylulose-5-phosphate reductoisomerase [Spirochaetaceae bacterium]